jgi:hypothetical protein
MFGVLLWQLAVQGAWWSSYVASLQSWGLAGPEGQWAQWGLSGRELSGMGIQQSPVELGPCWLRGREHSGVESCDPTWGQILWSHMGLGEAWDVGIWPSHVKLFPWQGSRGRVPSGAGISRPTWSWGPGQRGGEPVRVKQVLHRSVEWGLVRPAILLVDGGVEKLSTI